MPKNEDIQHSILIVSESEKFNAFVKKMLHPGSFMSIQFRKNAAAARRSILEQYFNIIVINAPLPDEPGLELAMDTAGQLSNASILVVVPTQDCHDVMDRVADLGVLAVAKPLPEFKFRHAIRFLCARQSKIRRLENKVAAGQEKLEELRLLGKAKCLLIEKKHMTEDEAHHYIGKQAMDEGISRRRAAEKVLEMLE